VSLIGHGLCHARVTVPDRYNSWSSIEVEIRSATLIEYFRRLAGYDQRFAEAYRAYESSRVNHIGHSQSFR
jgi:hypothetical protein